MGTICAPLIEYKTTHNDWFVRVKQIQMERIVLYIKELIKKDFGSPLHTLVIPGKLHFMEVEALEKLAQLPAQQIIKIQKL